MKADDCFVVLHKTKEQSVEPEHGEEDKNRFKVIYKELTDTSSGKMDVGSRGYTGGVHTAQVEKMEWNSNDI